MTKIGSGQNGTSLLVLGDPSVTTIAVEPWGRFAQLGAESLGAVLAAPGRRRVVPREGNPMRDAA